MAGKSAYLEGKELDRRFGLDDWTPPVTTYLALFTAAPTDAGGGTEVAGTNYERIEIANDDSEWQRLGSTVTNLNAQTFPTAGDLWGDVEAVGRFDALSGGNLLEWTLLPTTETVNTGGIVNFPAGTLTFIED